MDDLKWFDEWLNEEPDELSKRLSDALEKYEKVFGQRNINTEPCDDYDKLIKEIEACIELKTPYNVLYPDFNNYKYIDL